MTYKVQPSSIQIQSDDNIKGNGLNRIFTQNPDVFTESSRAFREEKHIIYVGNFNIGTAKDYY